MPLPTPTISLESTGSTSTPNSNMAMGSSQAGATPGFLSPSPAPSSKRLSPCSDRLAPPPRQSLVVPSPGGVFPLPNSQQVASGSSTGNPRNKVALKKGYSMMDWLRLTKSGKDLTGVGGPSVKGKIREISRKELKRHNSPRDAWMAINGMVFNVSSYLDYHPGGRDELMKGAGIDATDLFNQVHRWVNYESMLASCLVGKLVEGEALLECGSKPELPAPVIPPIVRPSGPIPPTTDYIQSVDKLTINIYTKRKGLSCDQVIVDNCSSSIRILTYLLDGSGYIVHYQLYAEVKPEVTVRVGASGKVEVTLVKSCSARWLGVGKPLDKHNWFGKVEELKMTYRRWKIVEMKEATPIVRLLPILPPVPTTLLYFNKTKRDIIWKKELAVFQRENSWLEIVHVLSKEPDYDGAQGRISRPLLDKLLWKGEKIKESGDGGKKEKRLVCICGMTQFSQEANRLFREEFGFQEEEIHLFVG